MIINDVEFKVLKHKLNLGPVDVRIVSDSMTPLICVDQTVKVEKACLDDLKPFDILLFRNYKSMMICHFYLKKSNFDTQKYITSGISPRLHFDIPVHENDIVGRVMNVKMGLFLKLKIFLKCYFIS